MKRHRRIPRVVALVAIGLCSVALPAAPGQPVGTSDVENSQRAAVQMLDRMPLLFVPEPLLADGAMGFAVRGREASVWLSETGIAYRLHGRGKRESKDTAGSWVVALELIGATLRQPTGENLMPTTVSYFKGPKEQWRTGLSSFSAVRYSEPWPGVDLVVSGTAGELESTFVVRPGADPGQIRLAYRGAAGVRLEPDGSLTVTTPLGEIREQAPVAYQEVDGRRAKVAAAFELEEGAEPGRQAYRFRLGEYDPTRELVVDPLTLVYCGYIGGSSTDYGWGIAVDAGNAYVTGWTESTESTFPVTVGPDLTHYGHDAFVAKVNASGTILDYCGYIGGSDDDAGRGIAVDDGGNVYVTGHTQSTQATFPVTVGPDLSFNGGWYDAFVAKINAAGTALDYCGYIGGSRDDDVIGIAIDEAGVAYVNGITNSTQATFPVRVGPDLTYNGGSYDAFVAKVNAAGSALDYCGYIGGSGYESSWGIAVDAADNAYVTGNTDSPEASFPVTVGPDLTINGYSDAYVAKVNTAGTALDYCGYIGGSGYEVATGIAVDEAGHAYVSGSTDSPEASFPVRVGPDLTINGSGDAFVAKVNAAGTALVYCGYIGGSTSESSYGIAVDAAGNAYVAGWTQSTEATFPVTVGPDLSYNGSRDAFVAKINAAGTALAYCGYIGGDHTDGGQGIAVDAGGSVYVTGYTQSTQAAFPVTVGPDLTHNGLKDAFVAKVTFSADEQSFIPAAAVAAGAQGAFFQTDVEINNTGPVEAQVHFEWLPRGADNSSPQHSAVSTIGHGKSMRFENVLAELFGLEPDSLGALKMVASTESVIGMSRTYNVPGSKVAGTFGQGLPAIRATDMIQGSEPQRIIFLSENDDSRANVGCVNGSDQPLRINIGVLDAEGSLLETKTMDLGPYSNDQINRIFEDYTPVNGYVDVWADSDDALYYCYGSMLDNLTSDPTTVLPQVPSADTTFIPAAALAAGLEGSFFQTDVDLNNAGSTDLTYELLWLPRGADNTDAIHSDTFSLAPGAGVRYANVLGEVFGLEPDQVGALAVEASGAELLAMSRTYNLPSAKVAGTFGQELPGIPADRMIPSGVKKRIIFMSENDDVRANVGCVNGAGIEVAVQIELCDSDGVKLETKYMMLPPYSNRQINGIFQDYAPVNGYVDVRTYTPDAAVYCYGSVLDNVTSDPTTVLPQ